MVTSLLNYYDPRVRVGVEEGYDGVVRIAIDGYYATGSLLQNAKAILTVAHIFDDVQSDSKPLVYFKTLQGEQTLKSTNVVLHPLYDSDANNDLAIIYLDTHAPIDAQRYDIYRSNDEISKIFNMVGYGMPGNGTAGVDENYNSEPLKLYAQNSFDALADELKDSLGNIMLWEPTSSSQLIADFDSSFSSNDALGLFLSKPSPSVGELEGIIAPGDSGSSAFIDNKIAGVASYIASLSTPFYHPDIDNAINSSFGEIAAWQRVSYFQQWIDKTLQDSYIDAPSSPSQVQKTIIEGDSGLKYTYFLLNYYGTRADPAKNISVDYATRDASAKAYEDYIPVSGTLVLYPNQNYAVIPVEIIADTIKEDNETFYLDIFNPQGDTFNQGITTITAMRTILNDDFLL